MDLRFGSLLIVTYGRTGSTLLQGLLNSIPGILIRGENENLFEGFWHAHQRLLEARKRLGPDAAHPWFGIQEMSEELFLQRCASLAKELLLGNTPAAQVNVYGFKEIRYILLPPQELAAYLDFLRLIFPSCGIIFNRRNHEAVLNSAWWRKEDATENAAAFRGFDEFTGRYSALHADHCCAVDYDKVIDLSSGEIERLFVFVGAPFDEHEVRKVLAVPHSFTSP
jgi:hypothetical protein